MSKASKACNITPKVRAAVRERDCDKCIFCGGQYEQICHFVKRSQLGLGIEQNLVCACVKCHMIQESGDAKLNEYMRMYLSSLYENWDELKLTYDKWEWVEK